MIAGILSCGGDGTAKDDCPGIAIERFYMLLENREFGTAAQMYSNKGRKLSAEELIKIEETIKRSAEKHKKKNGISEVIVIEEILIGDHKTAFVKYNIVYNNGEEDDLKQAFEKIDGRWYLKIVSVYK